MKKIIYIISFVLLIFALSSCQKNFKTIGESPVAMQNVTQNSKDDNITFSFDIPKNWKSWGSDYVAVSAIDSKYIGTEITDELKQYAMILTVANYQQSILLSKEEKIKMYDELFNGNPQPYKEHIAKSIESIGGSLDDFKCDYYKGKKGTLIRVESTTSTEDMSSTDVRCFRSDIPEYVVTGAIDETLDLSSGEIVLWVMDSLEVKENFKQK